MFTLEQEQMAFLGFPGGAEVKNLLPVKEMKCQPTPVFLLGKSNGQRNLVGYIQSQRGRKELDTTVHACTWPSTHPRAHLNIIYSNGDN